MSNDEIEQLRREHGALMLNYREVQQRCSAQIQSLARQVQTLSEQLVRTRAQLIARDSALAWERELRQTLVAQQLTAWLSSPSTAVQPVSCSIRQLWHRKTTTSWNSNCWKTAFRPPIW